MAPKTIKKLEHPENRYLTPRSHAVLLKSIEHGTTFRMNPYIWNTRSQCMEHTTDKRHLTVWYLNMLIAIANFIFVTIRAAQVFRDKEASARDKILAGFGIAYYLFPPTFQLTYFFFGDEFPGLINQGLKLLSDLSSNVPPTYLGPNQRYPVEVRAAELQLCNFYYVLKFLGVLVLIFGFELPETKFLTSSLVADPRNLWMPYRLLFLVYLTYMSCFNYIISSWMIGTGLAMSIPFCAALQALSGRKLNTGSIHHYRCVQLWIAKLNRIYSPLFLPIYEILLISLTTLGIVGVIRYPGVIGLLVGNIGLTTYLILYLFLSFGGTINERSRTTMESWRFEARGPNARQLRALRPISITIGSYCFIDRCLILTATNLIVNNSITLLLT